MVATLTPNRASVSRMPAMSSISPRRMGTTAAPAFQAMASSEIHASKAGDAISETLSPERISIRASMATPRLFSPWWRNMTPLGTPVDPDV